MAAFVTVVVITFWSLSIEGMGNFVNMTLSIITLGKTKKCQIQTYKTYSVILLILFWKGYLFTSQKNNGYIKTVVKLT